MHVEGLTEAIRAMEEIGLKTPIELQAELGVIGERVAEGARGEAVLKGDVYHGTPTDHGDPARRPGDLANKIKVYPGGPYKVIVREYSKTRSRRYPGGYPYPTRIEYGDGGVRAFMRPAAQLMQPVAEQMVSDMMDQITESEGF